MEIKSNIYSVGVVDSDVRVFHGYETPIGTTYNAYLIVDDKVTLVDTVKNPFAKQFLDNIDMVLKGRPIDYFICNHVEPDHSGSLLEVVEKYPNVVVYGTQSCEKGLKAYYPSAQYTFQAVKLGDVLKTNNFTFEFIPMPMVHWPDSMSTYLRESKVLFSNDALGQHIGTGELFDTQIGLDKLLDRAGDYYANIVLPFSMPVKKLLEEVSRLEIDMVCPSHGVILTDYIAQMVQKYVFWSNGYVNDKKVVIVYDSMWGTTKKLAQGLAKEYDGFDIEIICLSDKHISYAMAHVLEAKYVFVGSSTLNNNMLPTVSAFLTYMKGLKPKNKIGKAFGSYGWSGESIPQINDILTSCGFEMQEPLKVQWNI